MTLTQCPRSLTRDTGPTLEPLTLADAKRYLRLDHEEEDLLIFSLIQAAREAAESYMKRSLMTQTWRLGYGGFLPERIALPMGPVQQIVRVSFLGNGTATDLDTGDYHLSATRNRLSIPGGRIGDGFEILYRTGYVAAESIPADIRQGLLAHVASLYSLRGEATGMPPATLAAYAPYREVRL